MDDPKNYDYRITITDGDGRLVRTWNADYAKISAEKASVLWIDFDGLDRITVLKPGQDASIEKYKEDGQDD